MERRHAQHLALIRHVPAELIRDDDVVPQSIDAVWLTRNLDWRERKVAEYRELCARLHLAMIAWLDDGRSPPDDALVRQVLKCGGSIVPTWCISTVLRLLCKKSDDPTATALSFFRSAPARSRGWMMRFLHGPRDMLAAVVTEALGDKVASVREWAVEGVRKNALVELLPKLEELAESDPAPITREVARRQWHLMKFGFVAEYVADLDVWDFEVAMNSKNSEIFSVDSTLLVEHGAAGVVRLYRENRLEGGPTFTAKHS